MVLGDYVHLATHLALRNEDALLDGLARLADPPEVVASTLRYHHLSRPIRAWIPEATLRARLPPALADALQRARPIGHAPIEALIAAFAEVERALAAAGVPVLLLKGFYLAERLYGGIAHRPQSDVDLLVRRDDFRRAARGLGRLGFRRVRSDIHSRDLVRGTVKLDLHRYLRWAPALRVDEDAFWTTAIEARAAGLQFRTLSDEYTLVALALAAFENLGQGMERLKQIFDLWLLARALDPAFDWTRFLDRRRPENTLAIVINVLDLVVEIFAARTDVPRLAAALDAHRTLVVLPDRAAALTLLAAPRKSRDSLAWFARVYPGSLTHYLVWFWYGGFPANVSRLGPSWLLSHLRLARELKIRR